jgi:hypothetical protein
LSNTATGDSVAFTQNGLQAPADYDGKKKFVRYVFTPTTDDDRRLAKKA